MPSEMKTCHKCGGSMSRGTMKKIGVYSPSQYVWAPEDEPSFPRKSSETRVKRLIAYRCDNCGSVEVYAPA